MRRKQERLTQEKAKRKQEKVDLVRELHQKGISGHAIAAQTGLARGTVRKYLQSEGPRSRKSSILDLFYDALCLRWNEGCTNAHQLFQELQEKGYRGSETTVKDFVARLRQGLPGMKHPPKTTKTEGVTPILSPRELRWLLAKREKDLTPEEKQSLAKFLEHAQEIRCLYQLLQSFLHLLRERLPEQLNGWMKEARESGIKELISFVNGIERDYDTVRAGLTYSWSQGPVEGTVNKMKAHKRIMYGRASFTLLCQKLLHLA